MLDRVSLSSTAGGQGPARPERRGQDHLDPHSPGLVKPTGRGVTSQGRATGECRLPAADRSRPSGDRTFYLRISAFENLVFFAPFARNASSRPAQRGGEYSPRSASPMRQNRARTSTRTGCRSGFRSARSIVAARAADRRGDSRPRSRGRGPCVTSWRLRPGEGAVVWATQRLEEIRRVRGRRHAAR